MNEPHESNWMNDPNFVIVRFHYAGSFTKVGRSTFYVGGDGAECWIDRDRVSYFEIKGYLDDHYTSNNVIRMYWLKPGKNLDTGLVLLSDDAACVQMLADHPNGEVVDMYVEEVAEISADEQDIWAGDDDAEQGVEEEAAEEGQEGGEEDAAEEGQEDGKEEEEGEEASEEEGAEDEGQEAGDQDLKSFMAFYRSPTKADDKGKKAVGIDDVEVDSGSDDSLDEDYKQPPEEDSSAEDEEGDEFRAYAKQVKKNIKAKKWGVQVPEICPDALFDEVPNLDEPGSPYLDSSEEYSYGEDSDGEIQRWKSLENRFDSKAEVPVFCLGMAFRCSRQFKKALVKYGLKAHKSLKFVKDEKCRVKAICDWQGCEWQIYGSLTTRSKWFKVVSYVDAHTCPPRRDNKLVSSTLIAKHYYQQIKDNPTWKAGLIKAAVLKDLFADVSISKCKRAKTLVMQKCLDAMKGEYSRVFDYQLELERSNPGTTVAVCLDPVEEEKKYLRGCMFALMH